jgi:hypothetical protein
VFASLLPAAPEGGCAQRHCRADLWLRQPVSTFVSRFPYPVYNFVGDKIWQRVSKGVSYGIPGGPELTIFILKKVIQITVFIDL